MPDWTDLDFEMQDAGSNNNTWGEDHLNNVISRINSAFGGYVDILISGDTTLTTVRPTTSMDEDDFTGRIALLKFTGAPAANATITVPSVPMRRMIWNATSKVLTITTGAGGTLDIDAGDKVPVECDGANCFTTTYGGYDLKTYITGMTASAGAVPGVVGHAGKYLYTDGATAFWRQPSTADLSDYNTLILGVQVALAVAL
jgi:hypothetical protein